MRDAGIRLHWKPTTWRYSIGGRTFAALALAAALVLVAGCTDEGGVVREDVRARVPSLSDTGAALAVPFANDQGFGTSGVEAGARPMAAPQALRKTAAKSGCGSTLPAGFSAGKTALQTIVSGGMKRTYRVHVPAKVSTTQAMPLVLNFHGRSGTGIDQEITSGLLPFSDRDGFVLVSPDGTGTPMGWSAGATEPNSVDDVRFTEDMLNSLMGQLCIDAARVYATGFSNGAFMASRLACQIPDRIAAVVAVGGVDFPGEQCKSTVPVLAVHGTADSIVPISGGLVRRWRYEGAYKAVDDWAAANGCDETTNQTVLAEGIVHESFVDCAAATEFVTIEGCDHLWPGYPGVQAGSPASRISGAAVVWGFLSAKRIGSPSS